MSRREWHGHQKGQRGKENPRWRRGNQGRKLASQNSNHDAHSPELFGEAFHNPYTFLPFPEAAPPRAEPTPFSIDSVETDRCTGVMDLEIELLSPLLTSACDPAHKNKTGHQTLHALRIGNNVVLPASSVRGSLRSLMTVLSGGTLSHVDENLWLCQARDKVMGEERCRLARVRRASVHQMDGEIDIGETRFPNIEEIALAICDMNNRPRPQRVHPPGAKPGKGASPAEWDDFKAQQKNYSAYLRHKIEGRLSPFRPSSTSGGYRIPRLYAAFQGNRLVRVSTSPDDSCDFELKLSEAPIGLGQKRPKREGAFKAERTLKVRAKLWRDFCGRHRHANKRELTDGDLVWLELNNDEGRIESADDILSFQWARWGRGGENLLEVLKREHPHMIPDAMNPDGKVDMVTDLFGHVPSEIKTPEGLPGPAPRFAARIRTSNLVFPNGVAELQPNDKVTLAPLSTPNPGCAAFYRKARTGREKTFADEVNNASWMPLRGFKVYRTCKPQDAAPWEWKAQPIYKNNAEPEEKEHNLNKTVDLLTRGTGKLRISLNGLSRKEMALLFNACAVDWRLGGGKPLGLGWCRVRRCVFRPFLDNGCLGPGLEMLRPEKEIGRIPPIFEDAHTAAELTKLRGNMIAWQASQQPVTRLRYPRAVEHNNKSCTRGGHTWFLRHATPKKKGGGLQVMCVHPDPSPPLKPPAIQAQPLPAFYPKAPLADKLYGYDLFLDKQDPAFCEHPTKNKTLVKKLEPFDPKKHGGLVHQPGPNRNPNAKTRGGERVARNRGNQQNRTGNTPPDEKKNKRNRGGQRD